MPSQIIPNPATSRNPQQKIPDISNTAHIDPRAVVIGQVEIKDNVMVCPFASIRGDEGTPIFIGESSNVQDGVVIHGLETIDNNGAPIPKNQVVVDDGTYSVHIGSNVSLAHQSQIHGPAKIGDSTFIGMQAFVFKATIGKNCVLEPKSGVIGVDIPDDRYVPAGKVVTSRDEANRLPQTYEGYEYLHTNSAVVCVNVELAEKYKECED